MRYQRLWILLGSLLRRNIQIINGRRLSSAASVSTLRKVIVSTSDDIFTNLALEEWIYEHDDLRNQSLLLMWQNKPAVVIGRHQNPWLECDVNQILRKDVHLARRKSGGGTVYHDLGNLNLSFLMDRSLYDRKKNLELVMKAITQKWDVDLHVNERDDILLESFYKVSGTASKLGRDKTYHHFTLLHDVNKENVFKFLDSKHATVGVHSRATQSLRARIKNLCEADPDIQFDSLVQAIGKYYIKENNSKGSIQWIIPSEELFPGLLKLKHDLEQWEWVYGRTPKFSLTRNFTYNDYGEHLVLKLNIEIDKGLIMDIGIDVSGLSQEEQVITEFISKFKEILIGRRLWTADILELIDNFTRDFKKTDTDLNTYYPWYEIIQWISSCLKKTLHL
ncbi:hypothetical protein FSP39_024198 [Pinctada imbricata]|uniref:BPL/LPL catalytic domain-containing protein n=1 Tax=Pinctada imbricata TaxID=66713 RepID=A0AA88XNN9_PINIB|nr:hypothetical protein FSP39_024198 [Pinctada imbricata]